MEETTPKNTVNRDIVSVIKSAKEMFKSSENDCMIINTPKGDIKVLKTIPFNSARKITSEWFTTMYIKGKKELSPSIITELMDNILINAVLEPKLTKSDLELGGCPMELLGYALSMMVSMLSMLGEYFNKDEDVKPKSDEEEKETDQEDT